MQLQLCHLSRLVMQHSRTTGIRFERHHTGAACTQGTANPKMTPSGCIVTKMQMFMISLPNSSRCEMVNHYHYHTYHFRLQFDQYLQDVVNKHQQMSFQPVEMPQEHSFQNDEQRLCGVNLRFDPAELPVRSLLLEDRHVRVQTRPFFVNLTMLDLQVA